MELKLNTVFLYNECDSLFVIVGGKHSQQCVVCWMVDSIAVVLLHLLPESKFHFLKS